MNIWVIGRSYPLPINNMQGSFELEQAKMLAKHGHTVSYIACVFHPFKKVKKWGYCEWKEDNITVYTFSQFYGIERMKLHLERFQSGIWRKQLERVEATTGVPDVIHVHYPANITIAKEVLKYQGKGSRIVCTEHWSQVLRNVIDNYERAQLKTYADTADAFFCVGPPLKEKVIEITRTNREIYVMPNVINDYFAPRKDKFSDFTFVAVGVLHPNKQVDKIIEAFAAVFGASKQAKLMIIGDGPEADNLKNLAVKLGVADQVVFTGKLDRKNTAEKVGRSHALIIFSKYETFGVPIIEAWGCGMPVIATTAAAVNEEWDNRLGVQVSPDRLDELKEAMRKMYDSIGEYDPESILDYARTHYSEDSIYRRLMSFYSVDGGSEK